MDDRNVHTFKEQNLKIFAMMSKYLNEASDYVQAEDIEELMTVGISEEYAFQLMLASAFQLDVEHKLEDRYLFEQYFIPMLKKLDASVYRNNSYYRNIRFPTAKIGHCEMRYETYKPYEGFIWNDIIRTDKGKQLPQIGFFNESFTYPAVLENGRIWMTITPNEIETMTEAIAEASGDVLVFGLGLGYYPLMISEKENVSSITIVEMNKDVIDLFETYILPQYKFKSKITLVQADAFEYAEHNLASGGFQYIFTDLWHDVSDGIELYLKMKALEHLNPSAKYSYWIERSMLCYLE